MGRKLLCIALLAVGCGLSAPAVAGAAPGLLVGVDDDTLKWDANPQDTLAVLRDLGVQAVRVTVPWSAEESRLSAWNRSALDRVVGAAWGIRIVAAVYGRPDDAPTDAGSRTAYCDSLADLVGRYPSVDDVVVWNEPNVSRFWRPQFATDGTSVAPAAYEALLARCWDTLHALRPTVNVIAASSPHGNDNPAAASNISHSPGNWYRQLGLAYRASRRTKPIFDTVGHNAYPINSAERPWVQHRSSAISQGDYGKLMASLEEAFAGTGQPLPGQGNVSIWYLEQGFQSTIAGSKAPLYTGGESDRFALPALAARSTPAVQGPAPDQATQLSDAVRLAYCQPGVGAVFNFELADEPDLAGWQSGVLWTDGTQKPSYSTFKQAIADAAAGAVDCSRFPTAARSAPAANEIRFSAPRVKKPKP